MSGKIASTCGSISAGAVMVAPVVPVVAALVTAGIYIADPYRRTLAIPAALGAAVAAWLVGALFCARQTSVTTSNPRVYLNLVSLAGGLSAAIERLRDRQGVSERTLSGLVRLESELTVIRRILRVEPDPTANQSPAATDLEVGAFTNRRDWPLGTAYNELYQRLHTVDADRLLICDQADLLAAGLEDHFRLSDSKVAQREGWQYQLELGVGAFGKDPRTFFERPTTFVSPTQQAPAEMMVAPPPAAPTVQPVPDAGVAMEAEEEARFRFRSVRATVHGYRDGLFEGIVRQRIQTMWTVFATGCAAYVVVVLAELRHTNPELMLGGTVLFVIGALVGLFSRLVAQGESTVTIEDYGLSAVRLLQTVVLSGVAAVLGVVIVAYGLTAGANSELIPQTSSPATPSGIAGANSTPTATPGPGQDASGGGSAQVKLPTPTLNSLFDLESYPFAIILAAIFGLTPRLVLGRLESTANQLKLNIKSVEAS